MNDLLISSATVPALIAFFFTLAGVFWALKVFPKLGLMDRPERYGLTRDKIPYSVGIILFLSFVITTLFFVEMDRKMIGVLIGASLITFTSFLDDRDGLPAKFRLFMQVLVGVVISIAGVKIQLLSNPFGDALLLDTFTVNILGEEVWLLSTLFIVFWLVLMMNVFNWLDGIPGLTSGVGIVASIVIFILSIQGYHTIDQSTITILSISLAASLFAFIFFDFSPPKVLMGDTGSMLIGFLLGVFAIFSGGKIATALLIMGFPVLDAVWVIVRRILTKQSPFEGDLSHMHHRLLRAGLSERKALILNYTLAATFGAIALLLDSTQEKLIALIALTIIMASTATIVVLFERYGRRLGD